MAYYKASLLYLACINLEEQTKEDLVSRAHDLSIAALLGETIYNFGELVSGGDMMRKIALTFPSVSPLFRIFSCNIRC